MGDGEASHAAFAFELGKLNELLEEVRVDAETKEVTIRKPEIRVTEEWKIVMEWGVCCRCVAWVVVATIVLMSMIVRSLII